MGDQSQEQTLMSLFPTFPSANHPQSLIVLHGLMQSLTPSSPQGREEHCLGQWLHQSPSSAFLLSFVRWESLCNTLPPSAKVHGLFARKPAFRKKQLHVVFRHIRVQEVLNPPLKLGCAWIKPELPVRPCRELDRESQCIRT